jgi:hypothetical protein
LIGSQKAEEKWEGHIEMAVKCRELFRRNVVNAQKGNNRVGWAFVAKDAKVLTKVNVTC